MQAATQPRQEQTRHPIVRWFQSPRSFPWFWCIFTILPALFLLSFNYTISAPRLLVVPSVGISWLWGYTFAQLWRLWRDAAYLSINRRRRLGGLAGCLFLILVVGQNVRFVARFVHYHALLGDVTNQAAETVVEANENGRAVVLINFPNEVRGHTTTYPLGHEGVLFLVDYLSEQDLIEIQTGHQTDFALRQYNDLWSNERAYVYGILDEGQSWAELTAENPQATVYLTTYTDDTILLEPVGQLQPDDSPAILAATFTEADSGQRIMLADGCVRSEADALTIRLFWQVEDPPSYTYHHDLRACGGWIKSVSRAKRWLCLWRYISHGRMEPEHATGRRAPNSIAGEYTAVYVGLYNWMTGERLTAVSPNNTPLPETGYQLPTCSQ